jgi:hypothetical protein
VSEPLTARTAAHDVTGEKGAAWLAYLAARFAEGGGGRVSGRRGPERRGDQRDAARGIACGGAFFDPM